MSRYVAKLLWFCFLCGLTLFGASETLSVLRADDTGLSRVRSEKRMVGTRVAKDGCVLRLLVPDGGDSAQLPLKVELENQSDRTFGCGETSYFLECTVTLTSKSDAKAVSYSKLGRYAFGEVVGASRGPASLAPGNVRSWEFNLADAFEPLQKGKYLINVRTTIRFADAKEQGAFTTPLQIGTTDVTFFVSAERPMDSSKTKLAPTVKLLVGDDLGLQLEAQELLNEERQKLIAQLVAIIRDPENHRRRRASVTKAIEILGEWRAKEGVDVLVTYIGFPWVRHPDAGDYPGPPITGGVFAKTPEQLHPAVAALINIGEPCIDDVIHKLATTDIGSTEAKLCIVVLAKLDQRDSVRSKLERALGGNTTPKRKNLEDGLRQLDSAK